MKTSITLDTQYKSKISFDDHSSVNDILVAYYLPLIKSEAFSLYSALMIDARNTMINTIFVSVDRLISMINLSPEELDKSIKRLELVNLIEVFYDGENKLIFKLLKPLSPKEFNSSFQLSELFKSKSGSNNLEISNKLFNSMKDDNFGEFELVTEETELNLESDGIKNSMLNITFDFGNIKSILNARGIDYSKFWNIELEQKLIDIIVIYRVSSLDIGVEIISQIENEEFDVDRLISRLKTEFTKEKDINTILEAGEKTTQLKLDYFSKVSVRDYFISKLNREPSESEGKMISQLATKYGFSDEIINILIDFSIIVNSGAINHNYISKIADTLLKEGMTTPDQVIQHLRVAYKLKKDGKTETGINSKKLMDDIPEF